MNENELFTTAPFQCRCLTCPIFCEKLAEELIRKMDDFVEQWADEIIGGNSSAPLAEER